MTLPESDRKSRPAGRATRKPARPSSRSESCSGSTPWPKVGANRYFWFANRFEVAHSMKEEVSFRPLHIRLLSTNAVVLDTNTILQLIE